MERKITLSSFPVRDVKGNRPGDFTTRFSPEIDLSDKKASYYLAFNRIISMAFSCSNINSGYNIQKIAFSKDGGRTFTDFDLNQGVWDYEDINNYIKEKTKTVDGEGKEVYPINVTFDEPTFRVINTLDTDYRLGLIKSNFNNLIGFDKEILPNEVNIGSKTPDVSEDTDVLNIHCDLISDSLVNGEESYIIFSFGTGTLRASYTFVLEPRRIIFNPINRIIISSIRIYVTDGLRRPVYLNHADTAFSLILKRVDKYTCYQESSRKFIIPEWDDMVYKHRGNGLIVDKLMKPLRSVAKSVLGNVVKPFAKKAVKAGVSHAGERVGKAAANKAIEKFGSLIRQRLSQMNREQSSSGKNGRSNAKRVTRRKSKADTK